MAKVCGVCGRSGAFIGGGPCAICGKWVCGMHPMQTTAINRDLAVHVLSQAPSCLERERIDSSTKHGIAPLAGINVCANCFSWVDTWSKDLYRAQQEASKRFQNKQHFEQAEKLERAGRFEDAANEYEKAEAWDEAGRVRKEGSTKTIKTVSVDLNRLMEDLRRGGLALNFRCHSCGAGINIGAGGLDAPKHCPYCGVMIDSKTLAELLRTALR